MCVCVANGWPKMLPPNWRFVCFVIVLMGMFIEYFLIVS